MLIPPKYILTPKITQLLSQIESAKAVIDSVIIPPEIETNIRRSSTLKSSLFSARIEGNALTLQDLRPGSKEQKQVEVFNILKALNFISQRPSKDLSLKDLLIFHEFVLKNLIEKDSLGKFRKQASAIFNAAGIAIYMPPPARQVESLVIRLLSFVNSTREPFIPIKACLSHYMFEKIHPFLDGNGRVGRIVLQATLAKGGYRMKGLLNLEEYLDRNRPSYYRSFEGTDKDVTDFLEFMLEAIAQAAEEAKLQVLEKKDTEAEDYLLPRRAEILSIIKDHRLVNFEMLRRRFMAINERTLRYDLKKLQDAGLIRKLGTTKGVYYELAKP